MAHNGNGDSADQAAIEEIRALTRQAKAAATAAQAAQTKAEDAAKTLAATPKCQPDSGDPPEPIIMVVYGSTAATVKPGPNYLALTGVGVAFLAVLVAWYQLSQIRNDSKIRFVYELNGRLNKAIHDFQEDEKAAMDFGSKTYTDGGKNVQRTSRNLLGNVFNEYEIARDLREEPFLWGIGGKLIDNDRWKRITDYVCQSISGPGYEKTFDYLDTLIPERGSHDRTVLKELKTCLQS